MMIVGVLKHSLVKITPENFQKIYNMKTILNSMASIVPSDDVAI